MLAGHFVAVLACIGVLGSVCSAAQIDGEVVIRRKLSKRTVTAQASSYSRGPVVSLTEDSEEDPLAFERRHVVIYVEGDRKTSHAEATLEQRNRKFVPDLVVVPAGSTVTFPNRDVIFHNVFSLSKPKSFDLGNYPKGQTRSVTFFQPGIVHVNCHLHPNMGATVFVTPNEWSTTADDSGRFSLTVPAGRYTVVAWHKTAGFFRKTVEVTDDSPGKIVFLIPFAEDGSALVSASR